MKTINKIIRAIILAVGLSAFICSCNPQKHLNRFIARHPYLAKDSTYIIHDTTVTEAFNFDTVYNFTHSVDTVFLKQKNVTVKVYHYHDSIYLGATVKSDTIYKTIKVPVKQFTIEESRKKWLFFWLGLACALFALSVLNSFFKFIKP